LTLRERIQESAKRFASFLLKNSVANLLDAARFGVGACGDGFLVSGIQGLAAVRFSTVVLEYMQGNGVEEGALLPLFHGLSSLPEPEECLLQEVGDIIDRSAPRQQKAPQIGRHGTADICKGSRYAVIWPFPFSFYFHSIPLSERIVSHSSLLKFATSSSVPS
jgi:hypothetical protein